MLELSGCENTYKLSVKSTKYSYYEPKHASNDFKGHCHCECVRLMSCFNEYPEIIKIIGPSI